MGGCGEEDTGVCARTVGEEKGEEFAEFGDSWPNHCEFGGGAREFFGEGSTGEAGATTGVYAG
jgi:hypothetical protein